MQKKTIIKGVWLVSAVLWMVLIFCFSQQKAEESSEISGSLTYRITHQVNAVFDLGWEEDRQIAYAGSLEHPVRKAAHMTEYAILACVLLGNCIQYPVFQKKAFLWAFCGAVFYAATDEFHQLFIEGRSGEVKDICIDSAGALLGLLCAGLVICWWKKRKNKK